MNIHILGIRGLPSTYSGYETFVSELAPRLARRGHDVTVYCRRSLYQDRRSEWRGVKLSYVPSIEHKALSTLSHSFLATRLAITSGADVVLTVNAANGWFSRMLHKANVPSVINVDGMEWLRPKWNKVGKWIFLQGARMACKHSDVVVTDAEEMHRLYAQDMGVDSVYIAYGANLEESRNPAVVREYGLEPGRYFLIASRLVPDNNADIILEAFVRTRTDMTFAIAGGANYKGNTVEQRFIEKLRGIANDRVKFLGHVDSTDHIKELHCNCFAYVHGHQFGGINPSLLKALGFGNMILALNTPFNSEVLADGAYGVLYEKNADDLHQKMQNLCDNPAQADAYRAKARDRIRERFTWDHITDQYEELLYAVCRRTPRGDIRI